MLVIITERYDSSVLKEKVHPTPLDENGNPRYAIYLDDERATALIAAGVAEEYVLEEYTNDSDVTEDDKSKTKNNNDTLQKNELGTESKNKTKKTIESKS